jgi:hypothetical protein
MRPTWQAGYAARVTDGDAVDWRGLNRANWDLSWLTFAG